MIGSLRGVVIDRRPPGTLLVEVGGVGYRVGVLPSTLAGVAPGEAVFLHVHTHVREDALVLFGFAALDEQRCFEALLAAHGVGPALAMTILSALAPAELARALASGDVNALTAVPGVGKKTAARLMIDLRSSVLDVAVDAGGAPGPLAEVRAALDELGYSCDEVRDATSRLPDGGTVEELLTAALRQLAAPGVAR